MVDLRREVEVRCFPDALVFHPSAEEDQRLHELEASLPPSALRISVFTRLFLGQILPFRVVREVATFAACKEKKRKVPRSRCVGVKTWRSDIQRLQPGGAVARSVKIARNKVDARNGTETTPRL